MLDMQELKALAVLGIRAEIARLQVVLEEMIVAPDPPRVTGGKPLVSFDPAEASEVSGRHRRRRPISKQARAAISARMKRYWAAKRNA